MSLIAHLIELRVRLIRCVIAIGIGAVLGWWLYIPVLHILTGPLREISHNDPVLFPNGGRLLATSPLEPFQLRLQVSVYLGFMLATPVILWQLWRFVSPGLYAKEKKYAVAFVASATVLFTMGAAVAYFTLPQALNFLSSIGGGSFDNHYNGEKYLMLIVYMMLAFGGGFEFPVVLIFLLMAGVVKTRQLIDFRRWAYVIIAVVAAVITPSSDPISMCALMFPMWIFYEISIVFGRLRDRRRNKRAAAEAA